MLLTVEGDIFGRNKGRKAKVKKWHLATLKRTSCLFRDISVEHPLLINKYFIYQLFLRIYRKTPCIC
jgi:hypothetical protein